MVSAKAEDICPLLPGEGGLVKDRVLDALRLFLHPLTGGPRGEGWPFGRDVFLSDVAAVLKTIEGIDFVQDLEILRGNVVLRGRVPVPIDRIVSAGLLQIEMILSR